MSYKYCNPKAGMVEHLNDIRISSGHISCSDIKAPDEECCYKCFEKLSRNAHTFPGYARAKTKFRDFYFDCCCKHLDFIKIHMKDPKDLQIIIEAFLDFKRKEWGVNEC